LYNAYCEYAQEGRSTTYQIPRRCGDVVINIDNRSVASTFVIEGFGKDSTRKQYGTPVKYACEQANGILYKFF
jgi:hypothetical protein